MKIGNYGGMAQSLLLSDDADYGTAPDQGEVFLDSNPSSKRGPSAKAFWA